MYSDKATHLNDDPVIVAAIRRETGVDGQYLAQQA